MGIDTSVVYTDREVVILLRSAIALRGEVFDVWLILCQAHRVTTRQALRISPEWFVLQTFVKTGKGEGAEREGREESSSLLFVQSVGIGKRVTVIDHVVVCQTLLLGLVECEDYIEVLVKSMYRF